MTSEPYFYMAMFSILYVLALAVVWIGGALAEWRDRRDGR